VRSALAAVAHWRAEAHNHNCRADTLDTLVPLIPACTGHQGDIAAACLVALAAAASYLATALARTSSSTLLQVRGVKDAIVLHRENYHLTAKYHTEMQQLLP
jgi:hypothetical protein